MTKKTLIELMLENDIEWPEGAEFAAQDKCDKRVWFNRERPTRNKNSEVWNCSGLVKGFSAVMPELCRNWHQTIVTREQYENAQEMRDGAERNSEDAKPSKCIGKLNVDLQVSDIINQIAHHQAESQRHEETMLDHNDKEMALRDQLNEMLAKVGMKVVDVEREPVADNGGWPDYCDESGVIVDWDKVPEGSEVECVSDDGSQWYSNGATYTAATDSFGDFGPVDDAGDVMSSFRRCKFRLIK